MEFVRKYIKYIIGILVLLVILVVSFIVSKTYANPTVEVIKHESAHFPNIDYEVSLYSNEVMYVWGIKESGNEDFFIERNNITDFIIPDYYWSRKIFYLDNLNNLYELSDSGDDDIFILNNVKSIEKSAEWMLIHTNDNQLYAISLTSNEDLFGSLELVKDYSEFFDLYYVSDNVKDSSIYVREEKKFLIYRDFNNNLYALGNNVFGQKINEGNYLEKSTKILENVVQYSGEYILDDNGDLYAYSSKFVVPKIFVNNVLGFDVYQKISNGEVDWLSIRKKDNKEYIVHDINHDSLITNDELYEVDVNKTNSEKYVYGQYIVIDDTLYWLGKNYSGSEISLTKIIGNVKNIEQNDDRNICVLTKDNVLYGVGGMCISNLLSLNSYNYDEAYKVMEGVEDISFIKDNVIIMEDNTIWMYGDNYGNRFRDETITSSKIPVLVKSLPNAPVEVGVYDIELITLEKTDFTVGKSYDYYVNVFPYNAVNRKVVWDSSNDSVATVSDNGKIKAVSPGKSVISVETADGKIREEVEITVYPDVSGVEIINGDNVDLGLYQSVILTAKVFPSETLEQDIVWSVSDKDAVHLYEHDLNNGEYFSANQRSVYVNKGGTYTVTVTTKNGLYSDTVTIKTVEKVSYIELDIDDGHFDGSYNAFIYLNESDQLKVGYKVMPDSATNKEVTWNSSNPDVAEVSNDGVITGKKVGMTNITIESVDGNAIRSFNLLVYDSNKNGVLGDANGDGVIDIKDIIKLRRYLAGLEDLQ